jgi:PIN domain nuclease of toxin-antitoxin system
VQGYLLDTNIALIALSTPEKLPASFRSALLKGKNHLSVISYWEVVIKSMKGDLDVGPPAAWWNEALDQLAAIPVALRADHITALNGLPPIHRDPFDRILIAQAAAETLTLMTTDGEIPKYQSRHVKIMARK